MSNSPSVAHSVAEYAQYCLRQAGFSARVRRPMCDAVSPQHTPEQRALIAVGTDLVDLLARSDEGRQALKDLRLEPVAEGAKGE